MFVSSHQRRRDRQKSLLNDAGTQPLFGHGPKAFDTLDRRVREFIRFRGRGEFPRMADDMRCIEGKQHSGRTKTEQAGVGIFQFLPILAVGARIRVDP